MPELPDVEVYVTCLRRRLVGRQLEDLRIASPFLLRTVAPAPERRRGASAHERPPAGQAGGARAGGNDLPGRPSHDLRPPPLARAGLADPPKARSRRLRLRLGYRAPHGGRNEEARLPPRGRRRGGPGRARPGWRGPAHDDTRDVPHRAEAGEPHPQARADGPAPLIGNRERLLGRDPPCRPALAPRPDRAADGTRRWLACIAPPSRRFPDGSSAYI